MLKVSKLVIFSALSAIALSACTSTRPGADYDPPRLANGQPDFQGTWTNVSLTGLTRPGRYDSLTLSEEEAQQIEKMVAARAAQGLQPTDPNAPAPPKGSGVGGYNTFWGDSGESLAKINGEYRTSWIVDPKDGQLPYTEEGLARFKRMQTETRENMDGPEIRPMAERCIVGFGSTGGPPMLNVMYNNNYEIVQTDEAVMILVEMNHDARVIRLNDKHRPDSIRQWLGDSIGWWDGDTLVVETTNFKQDEALRLYFGSSFYVSPDATITEQLTRIADDQLFYEFTVDDPKTYKQAWRGEMVFSATDERIYEYACHEGNYAMPNILGGARKEERDSKANQ